MFNVKIKLKFCELKAAGIPMYKIAKEIGVHRSTLTTWNVKFAPHIQVLREDLFDTLLYENSIMRIKRVESISRQLTAAYEILDNPELQDKESFNLNSHIQFITKLTKLLYFEMQEKIVEGKAKPVMKDNYDDDDNIEPEPPIYITDKDAFSKHQPPEDPNTNTVFMVDISADKEVIEESVINETEVAKVFSKTFKRQNGFLKNAPDEKPVKNPSTNIEKKIEINKRE